VFVYFISGTGLHSQPVGAMGKGGEGGREVGMVEVEVEWDGLRLVWFGPTTTPRSSWDHHRQRTLGF
jgi:hypothetical protein